MRYTAHAIDGTLLFTAETAQTIGDMVLDHGKNKRTPHVAYTFDNRPDHAFPYTTWRDDWGHYIGSQHRTFEDVVNSVREAQL